MANQTEELRMRQCCVLTMNVFYAVLCSVHDSNILRLCYEIIFLNKPIKQI